MENPIGDGIDDAYAMMLMAEVTDASESETQASSTSSIAKFITATVNDDSGSTTYKPFSDFAGMFSSVVELGSIALSARAPDDATTPASDTTPYTSTYVESSQPTSIPLSDENLTPDKLETDDNTGAGNTPSMTVANAVTAVFLFVLASSIALAFATGWAPRILGFKLPAIRKSKKRNWTRILTMKMPDQIQGSRLFTEMLMPIRKLIGTLGWRNGTEKKQHC